MKYIIGHFFLALLPIIIFPTIASPKVGMWVYYVFAVHAFAQGAIGVWRYYDMRKLKVMISQ